MSDITEKTADDTSTTTPPTPEEISKIPVAPAAAKNESSLANGKAAPGNMPPQMLQDFLDKNGLELRLTPPRVRNMQDGGLLIDPPLVVVNYKQAAPAPVNNQN